MAGIKPIIRSDTGRDRSDVTTANSPLAAVDSYSPGKVEEAGRRKAQMASAHAPKSAAERRPSLEKSLKGTVNRRKIKTGLNELKRMQGL